MGDFTRPLHGAEPGGESGAIEHDLMDLRGYMRRGKISLHRLSARRRLRLVNTGIVSREAAGEYKGRPFPLHENLFVDSTEYFSTLRDRFTEKIQAAAINHLRLRAPDHSAFRLLNAQQCVGLCAIIMLTLAALTFRPVISLIALNCLATAYFISAILYRVYLLTVAATLPAASPAPDFADSELPVITILLPLYREASSLPSLVSAIDDLQYPLDKKDVIFLIEKDDIETAREAQRLRLNERFNFITVPESHPRTKPKACNFGMYMARGDLIVIYDAEDHPEADQLMRAAQAFAAGDDRLACVQARLNFENRKENWLTRLFTLEYSLWFDWLLPALQKINAPIPLGGTSNFFRTDVLVELGGWDPFNVTEDADLGLRLARCGYRTEIIDSTTYEEANCELGNWIRQRSRWLKGYIQTWLVHMRRPKEVVEATGWRGLISVQLFLAGNVFSALINPILWALFGVRVFVEPDLLSQVFPSPLLELNFAALFLGNLFFIGLMFIAPLKRGWFVLAFFSLSAPLYWALTSVAAYKALWQALTRPHFWEKTNHMLSPVAQRKRAAALQRLERQAASQTS